MIWQWKLQHSNSTKLTVEPELGLVGYFHTLSLNTIFTWGSGAQSNVSPRQRRLAKQWGKQPYQTVIRRSLYFHIFCA